MIGLKATNVHLGHGSFITMDFEQDKKWHLWIQMAAWRIDKKGVAILGCEDEREEIGKNISILEQRTFNKVVSPDGSLDLTLQFSDEIQLKLFSLYSNRDEIAFPDWTVWNPSEEELQVASHIAQVSVSEE